MLVRKKQNKQSTHTRCIQIERFLYTVVLDVFVCLCINMTKSTEPGLVNVCRNSILE